MNSKAVTIKPIKISLKRKAASLSDGKTAEIKKIRCKKQNNNLYRFFQYFRIKVLTKKQRKKILKPLSFQKLRQWSCVLQSGLRSNP